MIGIGPIGIVLSTFLFVDHFLRVPQVASPAPARAPRAQVALQLFRNFADESGAQGYPRTNQARIPGLHAIEAETPQIAEPHQLHGKEIYGNPASTNCSLVQTR